MRILFIMPPLLLAACASGPGHVQQIGPETYQLNHTIRGNGGAPGLRAAMVEKATGTCTRQKKNYTKLREEMGFGSGLTYTLTFSCTGQGAR